MSEPSDAPGIHGKLPSHGDFITRRLARNFLDEWDAWLQRAIAASKADLGEQWLDIYLTSPIWSFALGGGICGTNAWAGVLMPSVDRVGRYFPLTIAVSLPVGMSPGDVVVSGGDWFDRARGLALSSLEDDFSLDAFDESVSRLGAPAADAYTGAVALSSDELSSAQGVCIPLPAAAGAAGALGRIAAGLIEQSMGRHSLWWSEGSERVPACLLVARKLPQPNAWTALLDGQFTAGHWLAVGASPNASMGVEVVA